MSIPGFGDFVRAIEICDWVIEYCLKDANGATAHGREIRRLMNDAKAFFFQLQSDIAEILRLGLQSPQEQAAIEAQRADIDAECEETLSKIREILEKHQKSTLVRFSPTILTNGYWNLFVRKEASKLCNRLELHEKRIKRIRGRVRDRLHVKTYEAVQGLSSSVPDRSMDIEALDTPVATYSDMRAAMSSTTSAYDQSTEPFDDELAFASLLPDQEHRPQSLRVLRKRNGGIQICHSTYTESSCQRRDNAVVANQAAGPSSQPQVASITPQITNTILNFPLSTSALVPMYAILADRHQQSGKGWKINVVLDGEPTSFLVNHRQELHCIQAALTSHPVAAHANVISMTMTVKGMFHYPQYSGVGEVQLWWPSRSVLPDSQRSFGRAASTASELSSPNASCSNSNSCRYSTSSTSSRTLTEGHRIIQKLGAPALVGFCYDKDTYTMWRVDLTTIFNLVVDDLSHDRHRLRLMPQSSQKAKIKLLATKTLANWNVLALGDDIDGSESSARPSCFDKESTGIVLDFASAHELHCFMIKYKAIAMDYHSQHQACSSARTQILDQDQRPDHKFARSILTTNDTTEHHGSGMLVISQPDVVVNVTATPPILPDLSFSEPWTHDLAGDSSLETFAA